LYSAWRAWRNIGGGCVAGDTTLSTAVVATAWPFCGVYSATTAAHVSATRVWQRLQLTVGRAHSFSVCVYQRVVMSSSSCAGPLQISAGSTRVERADLRCESCCSSGEHLLPASSAASSLPAGQTHPHGRTAETARAGSECRHTESGRLEDQSLCWPRYPVTDRARTARIPLRAPCSCTLPCTSSFHAATYAGMCRNQACRV
jgi:hypothetical protein